MVRTLAISNIYRSIRNTFSLLIIRRNHSAVLATLIYLAVQIRQNTSAVATATYESTMTGFNDINIVVVGCSQGGY